MASPPKPADKKSRYRILILALVLLASVLVMFAIGFGQDDGNVSLAPVASAASYAALLSSS